MLEVRAPAGVRAGDQLMAVVVHEGEEYACGREQTGALLRRLALDDSLTGGLRPLGPALALRLDGVVLGRLLGLVVEHHLGVVPAPPPTVAAARKNAGE